MKSKPGWRPGPSILFAACAAAIILAAVAFYLSSANWSGELQSLLDQPQLLAGAMLAVAILVLTLAGKSALRESAERNEPVAAASAAPAHQDDWIQKARTRNKARESREALAVPPTGQISLFVGNICDLPVDYICVPTTTELDMLSGVAGAVRERAGWEVQEACRGMIEEAFLSGGRRSVPAGTAHFTGAGKMAIKGILHCAVVENMNQVKLENVKSAVRSALAIALQKGAKSVAIPAIGAGKGGLDLTESINAIIDVLVSADCPRIEKVWIVVHDGEKAKRTYPLVERRLGWIEIKAEAPRASADDANRN